MTIIIKLLVKKIKLFFSYKGLACRNIALQEKGDLITDNQIYSIPILQISLIFYN